MLSDQRNMERVVLYKTAPLKFPLVLQASISHVCNFKCYYCKQGNPRGKEQEYPKLGKMMTLETFIESIDNMRPYGCFREVKFAGCGEPLLNLALTKMICYVKEKKSALKTTVVTNASLLTPETSDMLLDARLDCLMISLQGISGDQYYKTSGVRIDYSGLIEQISYFYTRKSKRQGKQCRVILKIMDEMIPTPKDREVFSEIFGGIADELTVDSVMPTGGLVDDDHFRFKKNRFGDPVRDARVCAQPFYTVILDYDGSCYPCCQLENPPWLGNAAKSDFLEIWNAGAHFKLLKALLERRLDAFPRCVQCDLYKYMIAESDVLDGYEDEILNRLDSHE